MLSIEHIIPIYQIVALLVQKMDGLPTVLLGYLFKCCSVHCPHYCISSVPEKFYFRQMDRVLHIARFSCFCLPFYLLCQVTILSGLLMLNKQTWNIFTNWTVYIHACFNLAVGINWDCVGCKLNCTLPAEFFQVPRKHALLCTCILKEQHLYQIQMDLLVFRKILKTWHFNLTLDQDVG